MLNNKLFEEFGNESKLFFDELANSLNKEELEACYAKKGCTVNSGKLHGPGTIMVSTGNNFTFDRIDMKCIDISISLSNAKDEVGVLCIKADDKRIERGDGIKIWV